MRTHVRHMIPLIAVICLTALLAGALAGCKGPDTVKAPGTPRPDPLAGAQPKQIALSGLEEVLVSGEPIVEPSTAERPMRVNVPVRSVADERLAVQYQFIFHDERGRPLDTNFGWKYRVLEPRLATSLEGQALNRNAADWRLVIRSAR